jgi:hypothetical protein
MKKQLNKKIVHLIIIILKIRSEQIQLFFVTVFKWLFYNSNSPGFPVIGY